MGGQIYYVQILQHIAELSPSSSEEVQQQLRFLELAAAEFQRKASQKKLLQEKRVMKKQEKQRVMKLVSGNPYRKDAETFTQFKARTKAEAEERRQVAQDREQAAQERRQRALDQQGFQQRPRRRALSDIVFNVKSKFRRTKVGLA